MIRSSLLLTAMLIAAAPSAPAQVRLPVQPPIRTLSVPPRERGDSQPVPREYRPPPGMCRIWLEGVPASQQPAPTDCASAVRNRPNNGRVLFGDDYVGKDRDKKDRRNDKRPDQQADAGAVSAGAPSGVYAFAPAARPHGPSADDAVMVDARHELVPGFVASIQPPTRRDSARARPRSPLDRDGRRRRDSTLSERRRAIREHDRTRDRNDDPDDDDDQDDRSDRRGGDRRGDGRGADERDHDGWTGAWGGTGYGRGYYPPYPPPARANGVCLDRDGDGWCDDVRGGSQYCLDRDGDGRCDDYADLASAPYASSMPPMAAAVDVRRGIGSPIALRWLGTAEVIVRTSELRRTGTPYRAMWLDANTNRLLQVWTDRDGDGIADRVEIYRNGRIAKTIGR